MSLSIRIEYDSITPDLKAKAATCANPSPIWRAVGTQVVSLTKRSFREPSLRITSWKEKRDGSASNLIQKGMLMSSIRIVSVTADSVTVGSDRKYAAIHQLGGIIKAKGKGLSFTVGGKHFIVKQVKIPARPFFPFTPDGAVAAKHEAKIGAIVDKAVAKELGAK